MVGISTLIEEFRKRFGSFFDKRSRVVVARVPGRLDVMGGIGDYSGCLVLEGLIDQATVVAVQLRRDERVVVESAAAAREGLDGRIDRPLGDLFPDGKPLDYSRAQTRLASDPGQAWGAYVLGALLVLVREGVLPDWKVGVSIAVDGTVPFGGGVSSSASVEMAVLLALARVRGVSLNDEKGVSPLRLAAIGQILENRVAGAPCGIMDQITVTLGRKNTLLPILCRPHDLHTPVPIPKGIELVGINSNIKHAVGGSRYTETRVAAFMGHRIIADLLGRRDGRFYLSEIGVGEWRDRLRSRVPLRMTGRAFLRKYGHSFDKITRVEPDTTYLVRSRTEHPIHEQQRVETFRDALFGFGDDRDPDRLRLAGERMYATHWSYGKRCGLGCSETDLLVRLAREMGPAQGVYGAKISGGGAGGTVVLLIDRKARPRIREIARTYQTETGIVPGLFLGSSEGGLEFGVRTMRI